MGHYFIAEPTDAGLAILYEVEAEREGEPGFLGDPPAWVERDGLVKEINLAVVYQVLTGDELIASEEGRRALAAWRAEDDSAHHAVGVAEFEAHQRGNGLRLVP